MAARIEKDLRRAFKASLSHGGQTVERATRCCSGRGDFSPEAEAMLVNLSATIPEGERGFVELLDTAYRKLPENLCRSVLVSMENKAGYSAVCDQLRGYKLRIVEDSATACLKALNMVEILLPPLFHALDWLAEMPGIAVMGLGDRLLERSPDPAAGEKVVAAGPLEALLACMMSGPFDPGLLPDLDEAVKIRVGVIDSGIDQSHPFLRQMIEKRIDIGSTVTGKDLSGHGTHVAGIIAGGQITPEWTGIAPFSRLTDIRVGAQCTAKDFLNALGAAHREQLDVINISMGFKDLPPNAETIMTEGVNTLARSSCVCVSAGNKGQMGHGSLTPVADAREAIVVGAVFTTGRHAPFSSVGPCVFPNVSGEKPDVAAPGVGIISCRATDSILPPVDDKKLYTVMSGTSMATPMVSGLCAIGAALLKKKGRSGPLGMLMKEALCNSALDWHGEGAHRLGRGIPQLPLMLKYLREQSEPASAYVSTVTLDQFKTVTESWSQPACCTGLASPCEATAAGHDDLEARKAENKAAEDLFIAGVEAQLRRYGADWLKAEFGIRGAEWDETVPFSGEEELRDQAVLAGLGRAVEGGPLNRGLLVRFRKGGRQVAAVAVRSFAAYGVYKSLQEAAGLDSLKKVFEASCLEGYKKRVLVSYKPGGWGSLMQAEQRGHGVYTVFTTGGLGGNPFRIENGPAGFEEWLCCLPERLEIRTERLVAFLEGEERLALKGSELRVDAIAAEFGLAVEAADCWCRRALEADRRFEWTAASGGKGAGRIRRVQMLG